MNVLIIAAHPDDEVLGCGGTISRLAEDGASVTILILANGLTSRADFDHSREEEMLEIHHERARKAAALMGAKEVSFGGFPDQMMDTIPLLDVTQHGGDLNMDHVITFRATMTATRPMKGSVVRKLYSYEVASSTEWAFQQFSPKFLPQVFYDISPFLETKIKAMQIYESEARESPHPRSPEMLRASARRWGAAIGADAAEAFCCVREIY